MHLYKKSKRGETLNKHTLTNNIKMTKSTQS